MSNVSEEKPAVQNEQTATAPQQPTADTPAILIPPSQRQVNPKVRMISRIIGTIITAAILGVVAYREFATDKKGDKSASQEQLSPEKLIAQLDKTFTNHMMGSKPAQIKHLQGDEYGIWLDKASGEADIKITYDRKKNKWMLPKEGFSKAAENKISVIRKQSLSAFLTKELGQKPYLTLSAENSKNKFDVWMEAEAGNKTFTFICDTKTQTWRGATEDDQKMFELQKELKQAE